MPVDLRTDRLAQALKQVAKVNGRGDDGESIEKIASIEVIAYKGTEVDTEFGTTLVLEDKVWTVISIIPDTSIKKTDQFELSTGEKLSITDSNHVNNEVLGEMQWFICEQLQ